MKIEVTVCNICKKMDREVEEYVVGQGTNRTATIALCAEHCVFLEDALPARRGRRPAHIERWEREHSAPAAATAPAAETAPTPRKPRKATAKKTTPRRNAKRTTTGKRTAAKKTTQKASRVTPMDQIPAGDKAPAVAATG